MTVSRQKNGLALERETFRAKIPVPFVALMASVMCLLLTHCYKTNPRTKLYSTVLVLRIVHRKWKETKQ